jgi:predicted dehydrogenase
MARYRAGIIGCGRVGALFPDSERGPETHASGYAHSDLTDLVAGANRGREKLEEFGRRYGVTGLYTDYREMLAKERLDIVSIATHPEWHKEMVLACCEAGVKGIFCEKPLALSLSDCDEMLEACDRAGVKMICNHTRRWTPEWLTIRDFCRNGDFGPLVSIIGYIQSGKPSKDWVAYHEGPLLHDATHIFDLYRMFAGEPQFVIATVERFDKRFRVEDISAVILGMDTGVRTMTFAAERTAFTDFCVILTFERAKIEAGWQYRMWTVGDKIFFGEHTGMHAVPWPQMKYKDNPYIAAIKDLVECIETGRESESSGRDGRRSIEMIMGMYESARQGNVRIDFPVTLRESGLERMIAEGKL